MTMLGDDVLGGALTLGGADGRLQQGSRQGSKRQAPRFWNWRKLEKWKFQKDLFSKVFFKLMMKIGQHWIFIRNWTTNVVLGVNSIWNGMTLMWGCRQGRVLCIINIWMSVMIMTQMTERQGDSIVLEWMTLMWGCRQGRVRPGPSRRGWQSNEVLVIPSRSWEDLNQNQSQIHLIRCRVSNWPSFEALTHNWRKCRFQCFLARTLTSSGDVRSGVNVYR